MTTHQSSASARPARSQRKAVPHRTASVARIPSSPVSRQARRHHPHPGRSQGKPRKRHQRGALVANIGAIGMGAVGVAAAAAIGVGELMVGGFAAYVAYRVIRYGVAPTEALLEGVEFEHGELPEGSSGATPRAAA